MTKVDVRLERCDDGYRGFLILAQNGHGPAEYIVSMKSGGELSLKKGDRTVDAASLSQELVAYLWTPVVEARAALDRQWDPDTAKIVQQMGGSVEEAIKTTKQLPYSKELGAFLSAF